MCVCVYKKNGSNIESANCAVIHHYNQSMATHYQVLHLLFILHDTYLHATDEVQLKVVQKLQTLG